MPQIIARSDRKAASERSIGTLDRVGLEAREGQASGAHGRGFSPELLHYNSGCINFELRRLMLDTYAQIPECFS